MSAPEIAKQAQRLEELLYELKEQGYSFPGRMRDQVAKACDVSATKLARLKVIRDRLSESWTSIWEGGELPEATAYELAQGPAEFQERIFKVTGGDAPNCHNVAGVRDLMRDGATYDGTQVKKQGCEKCTHGDAFLRHDLASSWDRCTGTRCCLKCDYNTEYQRCDRACSKAKKARSEVSAKAKEEQAENEKKARRNLRKEIRKSAERLLKAAEAAGLDDSTVLPSPWWDKKSVSWLRAAADPDGDVGYVSRNPLAAEALYVPEVAKLLQCSTDYLYGLTDELRPEKAEAGPKTLGPECAGVATEDMVYDFGWYEGDPIRDGRYLCTVVWGDGLGGTVTSEQTCDWRDGRWLCYGREIDGLFTVRYWWPMPPKFENWMLRDEIAEEDDDEDRDN